MERREGQRGQPEDERLHRTLGKIHQRLKAIHEVKLGVQLPVKYSECCGSGMFIPDPGSECFPSRIPDPHRRI
jgi:hypothetical protein